MDANDLIELQESYYNIYEDSNDLDLISEEQLEIYECLISYLIDEGYADNLGSAEVILENMSDEWVECIFEGRIPWRSIKNPNPSGWMPSEKAQAKKEQLGRALRRNRTDENLRGRYKRLMNVINNPPVRKVDSPHVSSMEKYFKVNIGRSRREVQGRLLPKAKELPKNLNRRKIYLDMLASKEP